MHTVFVSCNVKVYGRRDVYTPQQIRLSLTERILKFREHSQNKNKNSVFFPSIPGSILKYSTVYTPSQNISKLHVFVASLRASNSFNSATSDYPLPYSTKYFMKICIVVLLTKKYRYSNFYTRCFATRKVIYWKGT